MKYFIDEYIKKGFKFSGMRTSRKAYWYAVLWYVLIRMLSDLVFTLVDYLIYGNEVWEILLNNVETDKLLVSDVGGAIVALTLLIPAVFISIRRLHDINKSGWWILTIIPPFVWSFFKGDEGENKYGKNPLDEEIAVK